MSDTITFAVSDEQHLLRDTARKFLSARADSEKVRADMADDAGVDDAIWAEMAQMGWQAMAIPEEFGGAGYGWTEVAVLVEEMGRRLVVAPYLSSAVLGTAALLHGGSDEQCREHLPAVASGEVRLTLTHRTDHADVTAAVTTDGATLTGTATHVLDGHTADLLLVAARDGSAWSLFLVRGDSDGLSREVVSTLDQTRKLATISLDGVAAERIGAAGSALAIVEHATTVGAVMLANEQMGGAQEVLEMSTAFAKDRIQFGRAIGSFQSIKHRLAELLVQVESGKSVAYHAARALDGGDATELAIAAPMAVSYCGEAFERAAGDTIQIHGGIGFTWEHDAHLYFKRAKSSKLLFGSGSAWRARLADTLGL